MSTDATNTAGTIADQPPRSLYHQRHGRPAPWLMRVRNAVLALLMVMGIIAGLGVAAIIAFVAGIVTGIIPFAC